MIVESTKLGNVEIDEQMIYKFQNGLPGFQDQTDFILVIHDESLPFSYLQSVNDDQTCLLLGNPFAFFPSYEFQLPESEKQALESPTPQSVAVWVTISIRETLEDATANLLAPLIFNTEKKVARQVILHDSLFETRTPLFSRKVEEK